MKQILKKIDFLKVIQVLVMVAMLVLPFVSVHAQLTDPGCPPGLKCDSSTRTLPELIQFVINIVLSVVALIALLFLIIGGFWYITSGGNEETAEKGKNTVINAIIGLVIIALSYVIVRVVINFVAGSSTTR